jgi:hypothetical protein
VRDKKEENKNQKTNKSKKKLSNTRITIGCLKPLSINNHNIMAEIKLNQ